MGVPNFGNLLPFSMRADLDDFLVDLKPNMANFFPTEGIFLFGRKQIPNSQPKFLFVNSDFFSAKNKKCPTRTCGLDDTPVKMKHVM